MANNLRPTEDHDEASVGKGQGGVDAPVSGNILAGVQPDQGEDEDGEDRQEG